VFENIGFFRTGMLEFSLTELYHLCEILKKFDVFIKNTIPYYSILFHTIPYYSILFLFHLIRFYILFSATIYHGEEFKLSELRIEI
jgi:hypothetical protein